MICEFAILFLILATQISEAFEVLSDSNKRAIYDQFGEEGLKGSGPSPGAGGFSGFSGFPGGGNTTFTFTSNGPGGFGSGGFAPTDPQKIFEYVFLYGTRDFLLLTSFSIQANIWILWNGWDGRLGAT